MARYIDFTPFGCLLGLFYSRTASNENRNISGHVIPQTASNENWNISGHVMPQTASNENRNISGHVIPRTASNDFNFGMRNKYYICMYVYIVCNNCIYVGLYICLYV